MTDRVRRVWVRPEHSPTECPGLVLEWRQNPDWEARVSYGSSAGSWGGRLLMWVEQASLKQTRLTSGRCNVPSDLGGRRTDVE